MRLNWPDPNLEPINLNSAPARSLFERNAEFLERKRYKTPLQPRKLSPKDFTRHR